MTRIETWETDDGYTVEVFADDCPESPREWSTAATLIQLSGDYVQPDSDAPVTEVLAAWERWHDVDMVARYLRLFHGAVAVETWDDPRSSSRIIGYVTRAAMDDGWPNGWDGSDAHGIIAAELEIYRQWCDGQVYGVEVTDSDGRSASLWSIYTKDGSTSDPYLRETVVGELVEQVRP